MKTPINSQIVDSKLAVCEIDKMEDATIRDVVRVVNMIEEESGDKFIRMEMGVPGLAASKFGIEAEKAALDRGVAASYPMLEGVKVLKEEGSKFIKNFMNVDLDAEGVIPTVGSMQGAYAAFMAICSATEGKDTILFVDPGFPVQKRQLDVLGMKYETFDIYDYRGDKLHDKLEKMMSKGNIAGLVYSNPNNPAWICMNEVELKTIGEMADKYDAIVMEDLAYFAMDFRTDLGQPGVGPYQPTVARYTDNYALMISSSKAFSYAGQRVGLLCISDKLYKRRYEGLKKRFGSDGFGFTIVFRIIYALSSGVSHSAQYGLHGMLKAANEGKFDFVEDVREYGERAKIMKKMFIDNGFDLVYDTDVDLPLADGFYFTISYPSLTGSDLSKKLLYYGISAICLNETGSLREGLRACVSQISKSQLGDLEYRLKEFHKHH